MAIPIQNEHIFSNIGPNRMIKRQPDSQEWVLHFFLQVLSAIPMSWSVTSTVCLKTVASQWFSSPLYVQMTPNSAFFPNLTQALHQDPTHVLSKPESVQAAGDGLCLLGLGFAWQWLSNDKRQETRYAHLWSHDGCTIDGHGWARTVLSIVFPGSSCKLWITQVQQL